jgi:hypothetical protein
MSTGVVGVIMLQETRQGSGEGELLRTAFDEGYFEAPREISLVQLAEEFGYDSREVSVELRRELREHFADCLD